jgi:hypothetical protein
MQHPGVNRERHPDGLIHKRGPLNSPPCDGSRPYRTWLFHDQGVLRRNSSVTSLPCRYVRTVELTTQDRSGI